MERNNKGQWLKGTKPHNYLPIGSEFECLGEIFVKNEYEKWERKQRYLYRKYHNLKTLPKKNCIMFLNGNHFDFEKENLYCISHNNYMFLSKHNMINKDKNITLTYILLLQNKQLLYEINEKNNKNKYYFKIK